MNWRRSLGAAVVVVPIVVLLGYGLTRDPRAIPSPLPGQPAPEFALAVMKDAPGSGQGREAAGDTIRLSELRGNVVVINFWASWCLACRDEHAALSATARAYEGRGVRFFGILYKDSPEQARAWIDEMGGQSYPTLLDPGSRTAIDFGVYGVPETFFIGPDGRVEYKHVGPVNERILVDRIEAILAASGPREETP